MVGCNHNMAVLHCRPACVYFEIRGGCSFPCGGVGNYKGAFTPKRCGASRSGAVPLPLPPNIEFNRIHWGHSHLGGSGAVTARQKNPHRKNEACSHFSARGSGFWSQYAATSAAIMLLRKTLRCECSRRQRINNRRTLPRRHRSAPRRIA